LKKARPEQGGPLLFNRSTVERLNGLNYPPAMAYTYEELKKKTVAELREIASGVQDDRVQGYSQMNKDHLLPALCAALGVEHEHHVEGIDKAAVKTKMRQLQKQRDAAVESGDHAQLKQLRRQIHRLNHQIRAHMS
jgi:sensor histidine kinase YesM